MSYRDDRELWEGAEVHAAPRALKLFQGYLWHPRELAWNPAIALPHDVLGEDVHLLIDELPRAPFTFFEDGTLAETQCVYQVTILSIVQPTDNEDSLLIAVSEQLTPLLYASPAGVGWEINEDLRDV